MMVNVNVNYDWPVSLSVAETDGQTRAEVRLIMPGGLLTDLYQLNMAASYLRRPATGQATFSLFAGAF